MAISAVTQRPKVFHSAPDAVKNNAAVVRAAIEEFPLASPSLLRYASGEIKDNLEIVLAAVRGAGDALKRASKRLKNNEQVVMEAVRNRGCALLHASMALRNDEAIAVVAVNMDGMALKYVSGALKTHRDLVTTAVEQNGLAIQFTPADMRTAELVRTAIAQDATAIQFLEPKHRQDREIMLAALETAGNNPHALAKDIGPQSTFSSLRRVLGITTEINDFDVFLNEVLDLPRQELICDFEFVIRALAALKPHSPSWKMTHARLLDTVTPARALTSTVTDGTPHPGTLVAYRWPTATFYGVIVRACSRVERRNLTQIEDGEGRSNLTLIEDGEGHTPTTTPAYRIEFEDDETVNLALPDETRRVDVHELTDLGQWALVRTVPTDDRFQALHRRYGNRPLKGAPPKPHTKSTYDEVRDWLFNVGRWTLENHLNCILLHVYPREGGQRMIDNDDVMDQVMLFVGPPSEKLVSALRAVRGALEGHVREVKEEQEGAISAKRVRREGAS